MLSLSLVVTCSVLAASSPAGQVAEQVAEQVSTQVEQLWGSSKDTLVIGLCEQWVADQGELSLKGRRDAIPKAKSQLCAKNALAGFFAGGIPFVGVDLASGAAAGFALQARGACIVAKLRGYDVRDNATQEMILWALTGEAVSETVKKVATVAATHGGQKLGKEALKKLPAQALRQVNRRLWPLLGRSFITKGPTGLLALGKMIPFAGQALGAIAGSSIDWYFCHKAIDWADQHVFRMIIKEEEELRNWLTDEGFNTTVEELLVSKTHLDIQSICETNKADLEKLGLSLGHVLKLRQKLFAQSGPCKGKGAKPAEEL